MLPQPDDAIGPARREQPTPRRTGTAVRRIGAAADSATQPPGGSLGREIISDNGYGPASGQRPETRA
jgi:hypothetical protein